MVLHAAMLSGSCVAWEVSPCLATGTQLGACRDLGVSSPGQWTQLLHPPSLFQPVAGLNVYHTHTNTEGTQRMLTQKVTQAVMQKALPELYLCSTLPGCAGAVGTTSQTPFLFFSWSGLKSTGESTHSTLQIHKHAHICRRPSTGTVILSDQYLFPYPEPSYLPHWVDLSSLAGPAWVLLANKSSLSSCLPFLTSYKV